MLRTQVSNGALLLALLPSVHAQESFEELAPDLWAALHQALIESSYLVTQAEGSCAWQAPNPAEGIHSTFTAREGVRIAGEGELGPWSMGLELEAWGRPGALVAVEAVEPVPMGRRVEYRRGPLLEWYVNDERGLMQGFTVEAPPGGRAGEEPLCLVLSIDGEICPEILPGGRDALFVDQGVTVMRYAGLRAWDSAQHELAASLAVEAGRLAIRIEDERAVYPVHVDPWINSAQAKLTASDASDVDRFGKAVAVWGDTAVVGAARDDHAGGVDAGSAYVFVRSETTWTEQQKLTASDAEADERFGVSVAISGETVVVGAFLDNHAGANSGSAYVFVRSGTTWTEQQKLTASDAEAGERFGLSVGIFGDTAVVGAHLDDNLGGDNAGAAYVFVRGGTTWTEQQKLTASDGMIGDRFGISVEVEGDTAAVGAYLDDHAGGANAGAAYLFVRSGSSWSEEQKLVASDAAAGDNFGRSVAVSGDSALVGADLDDHAGGIDAGSAYAFARSGSTWSEEQKLVASDAADVDNFGQSVGLAGDTALVGSPGDDDAGFTDVGAAYVFARSGTTWTQQQKLFTVHGFENDFLGVSVAVSGVTAVIGAPRDDITGAAHVFAVGPPVPPLTYCTAGTSASGCQAAISASGTPSASAPSGFDLVATSVEGAKDGAFFFGTNGKQAHPWGNGTSFQCVVPPVTRTGILGGAGTTGLCDGSFTRDLNAFWCPTCPFPGKNPGAGILVQAQLWYRDPQSTSNQKTSLSNAIEFCLAP